jgi:hypothetical protein
VPIRHENVPDLLQELDRDVRSTTFDADLQSIRDLFTVMQRDISVIKKVSEGEFERILLEMAKIGAKVKQTIKKRQSDQRAFIEVLIE